MILDDMILSEARNLSGRKAVIYLGDYIDRGPHSAHVIEYFCRRLGSQIDSGVTFFNLCGNHEEMFLSFIDTVGKNEQWLAYGGIETLQSYGIRTKDRSARQLALEAIDAVPPSHMEFLRSLPSAIKLRNYWFVHGFVDPKKTFERQKEHTLLWARPADFPWPKLGTEFTVVHGHTPVDDVNISTGRINIDTGSFSTGILSGVRITEQGLSVLRSTI